MPFWVIIVSSIFSVFIISWGIVFTALIPQFFGVHGAESDSFRGKLIVKLILIFPLVAIGSLYIAWTSNHYFALVPFVHFAIVYAIRVNKNAHTGPSSEYSSKQENVDALLNQVNDGWDEWKQLYTKNYLAILTFYGSTHDDGVNLKDKLSSAKNKHTEMELTTYKNGSVNLDTEVNLTSLDKSAIEIMIKELVELAWNNQCQLNNLDIMEGER